MSSQQQETAFAQGRREAAAMIRDKLNDMQMKTRRSAEIAVQDCLMMGQGSDIAEQLTLGVEQLLSAQLSHLSAALEALDAGETVYDLTGQQEIRTYKCIVGGDYEAGKLSMAEDYSMMLMSMDMKPLGQKVLEGLERSVDIKDKPEDHSEIAVPTVGGAVRTMMSFAPAVAKDTVLFFIEEQIKEKTKRPKDALLDNGEQLKSTVLGRIFKGIASVEHHSGRNARREAKIPATWPPFKNGPGSQVDVDLGFAQAASGIKRKDFEANDAPEFAQGFEAQMQRIYQTLQEAHYGQLKNGQYAKMVGLSGTWEKLVCDGAKDAFPALRDAIKEQIQDGAVGKGTSYADGVRAAGEWVKQEARFVETSLDARDMNAAHAMRHLQDFWVNTVDAIAKGAAPAVPSNQPSL